MLAISLAKGLHLAGIIVWCGGLLALPLLLTQHEPGDSQAQYGRLRRFTHYGYTRIVAPAAVIAIGAGTALVFLRDAFVPWMFAKLFVVALLVSLHVVIGGVIVRMGEQAQGSAIRALPVTGTLAVLISAILLIVLAKPQLDGTHLPDWLQAPRDRQLPLDEVPT
jgi:uncharacterized membrane protein